MISSLTSRFRPLYLLAGMLVMPLIATFAHAQETAPAPAPSATPRVKIILKLDDVSGASPMWKKVFAFLKEKNIKSSAGVICNSLQGDKKAYYAWIKEVNDTGLVEFWHHGWDHKMWEENGVKLQEFKGPSYEQQKQHLVDAQNIMKEKTGITFRTFGAPFNAVDDNTIKALNEMEDIKVFLYGNKKQAAELPNMMVLERTQMNIEQPLFLPNSERIKTDYAKLKGKHDVFVIQGHPNNWAPEERYAEFVRLIEFLISENCEFVTPYEYYQSKQAAGKTAAAK